MFKTMVVTVLLSILSASTFASNSTSKHNSLHPIYLKDFNKHKSDIYYASKVTGFSMHDGTAIASIESGIRNIKNKNSNANGVFQYKPRTWEADKRKYAKKYGVDPKAKVTNARANIVIGMASLADKRRYIANKTHLSYDQVTIGDIYMMHFLGEGGVVKVINGNPNALIGKYVKINRANANRFYKHGRQMTVKEFRTSMNNLVKSRAKMYQRVVNDYQLSMLMESVTKDFTVANNIAY